MKYKTSFFHKGLALNLLRRCWPVWLAYLAVMIFEFPMNIYGNMQSWRGPLPDLADMLTNNILQSACSAAEISFFSSTFLTAVTTTASAADTIKQAIIFPPCPVILRALA